LSVLSIKPYRSRYGWLFAAESAVSVAFFFVVKYVVINQSLEKLGEGRKRGDNNKYALRE
jgi:hypothetical protein